MVKRKNDKLNAEAGLLGFGAMRLATASDGSIDYAVTREMLDKAIAGGVNYFDTAYVYHAQKSEVFLGEELTSRYPRDSFYLATKLPTFRVSKPQEMGEMLDESLRRLKTDHIDFYLMHSLRGETWDKMKSFGVIDFMERIKKSGKVRRIGFSAHASAADFRRILDEYPGWEFTQIQVNYADWAMDADIRGCYEIAEQAGLPVIVMEPVRGGGLANPDAPAVKMIKSLLPEGVTPAAAALRWAAELKAAFVVLSGMSTVAQVEENLKTFSPLAPLSDAERNAINETINVLKGFPTIPCTSCGYCLDSCPNNIPIDNLFDSFNSYLYYANAHQFTQWYPKEGNRASDCIDCGACSEACPQHIDVPAGLKRVDEQYQKCVAAL